ncbi:anthranilate phosphoribosyltransferase [Thalassorhabdus alkalitolerans]|uniref:Anthranilate phosphoribosyltransferase n=1 Tax=Thalassorhabdus alkalitolerans TaxID=2282697 RepID=A0ABW0YQ23_9BACI
MIKAMLNACINGEHMTEHEAKEVMDEIMAGEATPSQIASLLTILRFRGESVEEMTGFARSMRDHVVKIPHKESFVIDTCGTGGDGTSTFNISTAAAIGLSAAGIKVAKHGNRSVSSKSGSADVLEELQVPVQSTPQSAAQTLARQGMSFLFAPLYHTAMKHAVEPRRDIGFRTIFNLLGPLTNPANAQAQVIGVFDKEYGKKMAEVLKRLGTKRAMIVTGADGLDEITITGNTYVTELNGESITHYEISPEEIGADLGTLKDIQVNTPKESSKLIYSIFSGEKTGAAKDIVLLNIAAGLYVAGQAESLKEGYERAKQCVENGTVLRKLEELKEERMKQTNAN